MRKIGWKNNDLVMEELHLSQRKSQDKQHTKKDVPHNCFVVNSSPKKEKKKKTLIVVEAHDGVCESEEARRPTTARQAGRQAGRGGEGWRGGERVREKRFMTGFVWLKPG